MQCLCKNIIWILGILCDDNCIIKWITDNWWKMVCVIRCITWRRRTCSISMHCAPDIIHFIGFAAACEGSWHIFHYVSCFLALFTSVVSWHTSINNHIDCIFVTHLKLRARGPMSVPIGHTWAGEGICCFELSASKVKVSNANLLVSMRQKRHSTSWNQKDAFISLCCLRPFWNIALVGEKGRENRGRLRDMAYHLLRTYHPPWYAPPVPSSLFLSASFSFFCSVCLLWAGEITSGDIC